MAGPPSKVMMAVEITASGGPDVLKPTHRPIPVPARGQVLVAVAVAGVNGPDLMQRKGLYPPPEGASNLLGLEVAGTIAAVGESVTRWHVGDAVCALSNGGGYAQYVAVTATHCLPIPAGLDVRAAGSLPETYFTVWSNIFMRGQLQRGQTLLVHGGAGGIGSTAIQLGKAFGAKVFTTIADDEQKRFCEQLGADRAINFHSEDFVEVVRREAKGADFILDIIGGPYVERNIKAAAPGAHIVQLAFALGSKIEINLMPIMLKRVTYTGSTLRSRSDAFKSEVAMELERQVWPLFEKKILRPVVNRTFALADAAAAHRLMESAGHTGKILLTV